MWSLRRRRGWMRSLRRRRRGRMRSLRSGGLRGLRRSALGWRLGSLRRRSLLLFVLLGFRRRLLLRDHHWCALRMRGRACELHRSESGRGKQHEAKFCHDDVDPGRKVLKRGDQRTAIRPDCGGVQTLIRIYFVRQKARKRHYSWCIQALVQVGIPYRRRKAHAHSEVR